MQIDNIYQTIENYKGASKGQTGYIYSDSNEFDRSQYKNAIKSK